ncbi:MAG: NAD(P)H-dependent oxidoreductase subunit E [Candidatus Calescibacterium sp.]|nr:NAD(P)H-dependent oxidoreductase subunit E [Candidatus Calescibacterium sp.]MCX7734011.1 NAD(P)H-dependent oxidoreductase subunit E [bacterium]MDW8086390.1 NAD(P)H-dependent oxidoreductase subunit E [Candidatus Calescibacterium sp.]
MAKRRIGITHIHSPDEQVPFEFLPAEYGVYKDNLKEWANEHYIAKRFPKKGSITEEEKNRIKSFFETRRKEFPDGTSALLPVLNDIKKNYGVVYTEYMDEVANLFGVHPSYVLGVATFYTMLEGFDGKAEIYVCNSLPCYLQGSEEILQEFLRKADDEVEIREWVCLGRCEFAPVVHIPYTEKSFGHVTKEDVEQIIKISKEVCPWRNKK